MRENLILIAKHAIEFYKANPQYLPPNWLIVGRLPTVVEATWYISPERTESKKPTSGNYDMFNNPHKFRYFGRKKERDIFEAHRRMGWNDLCMV